MSVVEAAWEPGQSDSEAGCSVNRQAACLVRFTGSDSPVPRPRDPHGGGRWRESRSFWDFLVSQWWRILRSLMREDPTCHRGTEPVRGNCCAEALGPTSRSCRACVLQVLKPTHRELVPHNGRSHRRERPLHHNQRWAPLAATRESLCTSPKMKPMQLQLVPHNEKSHCRERPLHHNQRWAPACRN